MASPRRLVRLCAALCVAGFIAAEPTHAPTHAERLVLAQPAIAPLPVNDEADPNATTVEIRPDIPFQPAEAGAAPPQHPDPPTLARLAKALRIAPNNLSFSSNISYDEHGRVRHQSTNGSINFQVKYDNSVQPIAYDNFRLTRIVTDNGTEVPVIQDPNRRHNNQFGRNNHGRDGGSFNLYANNLPQPPGDARSLAILEGAFDLRYVEGKAQPAIFDPIEDFDGVWVGIEQFPDSRVRVSRLGERLRVDFDPATFKLFAHPEFFTGDRTSINVSGWSSSSNNDRVNRTYNVDLDPKGRVVLWFHRDVKTITVPFRVKNLALPERPQSDGVDLVIRLGEDPANNPDQPNADRPVNELKLVVPNKPDAG